VSWVIIQLTNWAQKFLTSETIDQMIRKKLEDNDIEIFYPVSESGPKKVQSPYSEYVFIENKPGLDFSKLDQAEEVKQVLREPHTGKPQLASDSEIQKAKDQLNQEKEIRPGDVVKVLDGPFRGNYGDVISTDETSAELELTVATERLSVSMEKKSLKRSPRKTHEKRVKKEPLLVSTIELDPTVVSTLVVPENFSVELDSTNLANMKITKVVRKGLKNTRVLINGISQLIPNEKLNELLEREKRAENVEGVSQV
jgi:transcription antitermination factor NusG